MKHFLWYLKTLPLRIWYFFRPSFEISLLLFGYFPINSIINSIGNNYFKVIGSRSDGALGKLKIKKIVKPYEAKP